MPLPSAAEWPTADSAARGTVPAELGVAGPEPEDPELVFDIHLQILNAPVPPKSDLPFVASPDTAAPKVFVAMHFTVALQDSHCSCICANVHEKYGLLLRCSHAHV